MIINLEMERERRDIAALEADDQEWQRVCERVFEVLDTAAIHPDGLISATLNALFTVLAGKNVDMDSAKKAVAERLPVFR